MYLYRVLNWLVVSYFFFHLPFYIFPSNGMDLSYNCHFYLFYSHCYHFFFNFIWVFWKFSLIFLSFPEEFWYLSGYFNFVFDFVGFFFLVCVFFFKLQRVWKVHWLGFPFVTGKFLSNHTYQNTVPTSVVYFPNCIYVIHTFLRVKPLKYHQGTWGDIDLGPQSSFLPASL